jgi:L-galactose dehydrogenase/L-glyceraldehyde 3-phosphate reductase
MTREHRRETPLIRREVAMRQRPLGRAGALISEIGFGCGNVGGLLIRGEPHEHVRAVARAIELGITYFDTAAQYGDGRSEESLGRALAELKANVMVGTKINVSREDLAAGEARVRALFQAGLARLNRKSVDILFYHGRIRREDARDGGGLTASQVRGPLLDALRALKREGSVRFVGFTGLGDTDAVLEVVADGGFDVFHCYYNAVNPSAGHPVPPGFPAQDLGQMIDRAAASGTVPLAIRILAAGALAGAVPRHPLAGGTGGVLVQGTEYDSDVERAERLRPIAAELGINLPELAVRFALSNPEIASALVGISSVDQVDEAARAAEAGPLPDEVVQRIVRTTIT